MTIDTRDGIVSALGNNNDRVVIDKASIANAVIGQDFSLWRATGAPGQGAIPGAAAICTSALTGAMSFANQTAPATSYFDWCRLVTSLASQTIEFHDRLAHMGGLSGTVVTAQGALNLTGLSAARLGATDYSDVQWWLEWYTDTGATNVNATVAVTYNDDSTGNLAAIALGATARASRAFRLVSAVAGKWIKSVNSVTLSATTTAAGNFGITASRPRTGVDTDVANKAVAYDWAKLGHPEIPNDACIYMVAVASATSTGTVRGMGKITHG